MRQETFDKSRFINDGMDGYVVGGHLVDDPTKPPLSYPIWHWPIYLIGPDDE